MRKNLSDFLDMIYMINRIINHENLVNPVKISNIFGLNLVFGQWGLISMGLCMNGRNEE